MLRAFLASVQPRRRSEPRVNLADGAVLSPRIRALLDKRQQQVGKEKLTKRLVELQEIAPEGKPPVDP